MRTGPPDVMGCDRKLKQFTALPKLPLVLLALYLGVCFPHASPTVVKETYVKRI